MPLSSGESPSLLSPSPTSTPILRANRDCAGKIALTFDDGPHPTKTAPILDLLSRYGVRATFFVIGANAEAHADLVAREVADGHEIANHTFSHPDLSRLDADDVRSELTAAENAILDAADRRPRVLRPPGGCVSEKVSRLADELGYSLVLWSVDTRDWAHTATEDIIKNVRTNIKSGDVILFHDFVSGRSHTLDALEVLIPELLSEGYEFVTVSELFGIE